MLKCKFKIFKSKISFYEKNYDYKNLIIIILKYIAHQNSLRNNAPDIPDIFHMFFNLNIQEK